MENIVRPAGQRRLRGAAFLAGILKECVMRKFLAGLSGAVLGLMLTSSAWACHSLSDGEVTQIDTEAKQVVVAKGDKTHTFTTADKTKILLNGEEASLADLKAGDRVHVDYEAADDVLKIVASRES
jgi:Cu/Ag efflux protein CusF